MILCIFHKFELNPIPKGLETVVLSFLYLRKEETPHQSNSTTAHIFPFLIISYFWKNENIIYVNYLYQLLILNIIQHSRFLLRGELCLRNNNGKTANRQAWMCRPKWLFTSFQVLHRQCCMSQTLILHKQCGFDCFSISEMVQ